MVSCAMDLPVNIPWKLIAASPDMMDTRFCNKLFPFAWRSSLALSVYEPKPEDLPDGLCGQRLTYLKITCSITGYQPTREETGQIVALFPDVPTEDQRAALDRILAEYFACYGVLLNVAVFPGPYQITKDVTIDFATRPEGGPDTALPNPYAVNGVKFDADGLTANHLVDRFPSGGDGHAELDLGKRMTVTFPPNLDIAKITASVAHASTSGVVMEAFSGGTSQGSRSTSLQQNVAQSLTITGSAIDRVVFTAVDDHAVLLALTYGLAAGITSDTGHVALDDFPHIIDFEPKVRDLYQAATEAGELLSGSKSGIKTDKSFTHTHSTEDSLSLGVEFPIPDTPAVGKVEGKHATTDSDQTQWAVQADASRERRETQSTTTQITQMYNLLTGYHVGTNRAVFLMLARPHVLQPTDFRTFAQGLRAIEGVQEFFLIVSRPATMEGLCVEAWLETGHFPEDAAIKEHEPEYDESYEDFVVKKSASGGYLSGSCTNLDSEYTIAAGSVVDRRDSRGPDPGHPGMKMLEDRSNGRAKDSLQNYNYLPTSDASVSVVGKVCGSAGLLGGDSASFDRTYRVFTRSEKPKTSHEEPSADVGRFVITARELCVCFRSKDSCPEVVRHPDSHVPLTGKVIVDEPVIRLPPGLLTGGATTRPRGPIVKAFLRQIERSLANSWRRPNRYPLGEVGYLESDAFRDRIESALAPAVLRRPVGEITGLPPVLGKAVGPRTTVGDLLRLDLTELAHRAGVPVNEAAQLRATLLTLQPSGGRQ